MEILDKIDKMVCKLEEVLISFSVIGFEPMIK
jgi:hypothetical protein